MAAMTNTVISVLALLAFTSAYPYNPYTDFGNLSPDEFMGFLEEQLHDDTQPQGPVLVSSQEFNTDGQGIGVVSGIDVDTEGYLFVFHRAGRQWTAETFDDWLNTLTEKERIPIKNETIFKINPTSGRVISKMGGNLFNVPHGLTIDKDDNIWVTDVGRHQVFRFPKGSTTPDLELGETFIPGNDDKHFCKPTDVAVASNGEFFVADGYCNSRILKFSKDGKFIAKWGTPVGPMSTTTPYQLNIPHSITLVEELNLVCVADRENQRASCFNAGLRSGNALGTFNRTVVPRGEIGKIYSLKYIKASQSFIAAGELSTTPYPEDLVSMTYPPRVFTYSLVGQVLENWAYITPAIARDGPTLIHDLSASHNGHDFFLGDIIQKKVFKYTKLGLPVVG